MATNGFFKALGAKLFGLAKADEVKKAEVTKPFKYQARDGGHKGHKTGAFGGTGTGRGRRGMPGRKLIKKTVKSGWSSQKRVTLSTKAVTK